MTKREERELFFKAVFMTEFLDVGEDCKEVVTNFLDSEGLEKYSDKVMIRVQGLCNQLSDIDEVINSLAEGWKTSRIAKVDLALLRVAIYEMQYEGLEKGIAINEVVELAKEYGESRSYAFINGILAKVGD